MSRKIRCIVPHCDYHDVLSGTHRFPEDLKFRQLWSQATGFPLQNVKTSSRVCHRHFDENLHYTHGTKFNGEPFKRTNSDAVPTKFLVSSIFNPHFLSLIFSYTVFKNPSKSLFSS